MDPDATLANIRDQGADLFDRTQAALDLDRWLFNGGYKPEGFTREQAAVLNAWRVNAVATFDAI